MPGTIRRVPEDFQVVEVLEPGVVQPGPPTPDTLAVYELTKVSLTTPEACARLAAALGVCTGDIAWAGLKDKHAQTTQHVTAPFAVHPAEAIEQPGLVARLVGHTRERFAAEVIRRNRFRIVVRGLTPQSAASFDERVAHVRTGTGDLLVPNLFGEQRFESARHGEGFAARALVRGDFEGALRLLIATPSRKDAGSRRAFVRACAERWGRWRELADSLPHRPERWAIKRLAGGGSFREAFAALPAIDQQMAVEAYQSWIWNATVLAIVRTFADGVVEAEDDESSQTRWPMVRPASIPSTWRGVGIPLPGPEASLREPWRGFLERVLEAEGVALRELRIPGFRRPTFGSPIRPMWLPVESFEIGPGEPDEMSGGTHLKRTFSFALRRGGYATVVLRFLGQ